MAAPAQLALVSQAAPAEAEARAMDAAAEDLLEATVREHARLAFRIAYSVLRNPADAEDATQEVFLRVLRQRKRLGEVDDRRAWVARIAWRVAVDQSRARRRQQESPLEEAEAGAVLRQLLDSGADAERVAANRQMLGLVEQLIAALPAEFREVTVLSTVEELSARQVAEVLGIPEVTARTRLFRARQMLREKLERVLGGSHGV